MNDNFHNANAVLGGENPADEASHLPDLSDTVATVDTSLAILAERVDRLTGWCERLMREHYALNEQLNLLKTERDELRTKNGQLRTRIDAMVVRLKGLGQNS